MSMIEYFSKKAKKVASFNKLDELKSKAQKMVTDQLGNITEFNSYFKDKYPGIEEELREVVANQYIYHKAVLENEKIKASNPELELKFAQIDEAFNIDRIVRTGSIEKYQAPESYNRFMAHNRLITMEKNIANDEASVILSQYFENAKTINQFLGKISLKEAVSSTLYGLIKDAFYYKNSITNQNHYVNRAIDEYNQQYEYCYLLYQNETKAERYTSMDRFSLDKFEKSKYVQLLSEAFNPTIAKEKARVDLEKTKKQDPSTM